MGRARHFIDSRIDIVELLLDMHSASSPQGALEAWVNARSSMETFVIEYEDKRHYYRIDGEDVPSVTSILDYTRNKPALNWWSFRVGLAGIVRAVQQRKLTWAQLLSWAWEPIIKPDVWVGHDAHTTEVNGKSKHEAERLALTLNHSPNHIKEEKGTIGTSIHVAAEELGDTGLIPAIETFPEADRGYIQALARWYVTQEPEITAQELIVGSKTLGFAGRFDLTRRDGEGLVLTDYKTSGGVYPDYDIQLGFYWIGYHEMRLHEHPDFGPLTGAEVVHLRPDGTFEVVPMSIDLRDPLTELLAFHQRRDLDDRVKALGRKA